MNKYSSELNSLIEKINDLHTKVSSSVQPSFIDLHLLCDYTRKYYDLLIATNAVAGAAPVTNASVFEIKHVAKEQPTVVSMPENIVENKPVVEPIKEDVPEASVSDFKPKDQQQEKFKDYASIGDAFSEKETVGNKYSSTQPNAVSDKLKITPLADLNDAIGINERFAFANVFMNGDINSFYSALAQINSKQNFEEAFTHFKTEVVEKFNVDKNNKLYREFLELLQRRFTK